MAIDKRVFNVVQIIDDYRLIINGGAQQGVKPGDEFEVYIEGTPIIDPFNPNNTLGTIDAIKAIIEVETIYDNMTICLSAEYTPSGLSAANFLATGGFTSSRKKLNVDPGEMLPLHDDYDLEIRVGDTVRHSRQKKEN